MRGRLGWLPVAVATIAVSVVCGVINDASATLPPLRLDPDGDEQKITVNFVGIDRPSLTVTGRRLCADAGILYLPLADVAAIVNGGRFWRDETMQLRLTLAGRDILLTHGSRLVILDDREVVLQAPPFAFEGDLWAPVTLFERVLAPLTGEATKWDMATATLSVGGVRPNITAATIRSSGRSTTLSLDCSEALRWRLERPDPERVRLTIYGGILDGSRIGQLKSRGLIRSVTVRQDRDRAVIDVSVLPLTSGARTHAEDDGRTIVLALDESASGLPTPTVRGTKAMAEPEVFGQGAPKVEVVVIDPGHGGDDVGVIGPDGEREKDIVLALARELKNVLKEAGFTVVMTRDGDDDRTPDDRAEQANLVGGDLFLSLHAGAWFDTNRRGAAAWTMIPGGPISTEEFAPWGTIQQRHLTESVFLSETVLARLALDLKMTVTDPGLVNSTLLQGVDMPAVMLEVGMLTHAADLERLTDRGERQRLARCLGSAVVAYRSTLAERQVDDQGGRP